jgi:hypothetical protein
VVAAYGFWLGLPAFGDVLFGLFALGFWFTPFMFCCGWELIFGSVFGVDGAVLGTDGAVLGVDGAVLGVDGAVCGVEGVVPWAWTKVAVKTAIPVKTIIFFIDKTYH